MKDANARIALIDDDTTFVQMLHTYLSKHGFVTQVFGSATNAQEVLVKDKFDLIITDYRMPGMDGLELLQQLKGANAETPVILLTSYGDIGLAVRSMKAGAVDYLTKPVNPEELLALVKNTLQQQEKRQHIPVNTSPVKPVQRASSSSNFVSGKSPQTKLLLEHLSLVGPTNMSVLIQGESGTGKEYIAQRIHEHSKRKQQPFVAIDCGALSKDLAASELFGHKKGSFTGALGDKTGQFKHADGGTLFLDEIGNLSYEVQIKLLRALQEKVIRPLGSDEDIKVDVRLIAATNENLRDAIKDGDFREDLYHRLNEFKLDLSPLRSRPEEIEQFARFFLEKANEDLEKDLKGFEADCMEALLAYSWPGNLRELKNVVKRAALLSPGESVLLQALPSEVLHNQGTVISSSNTTDLKELESTMERQKILEAMEKVRYNKSKAAKLLNIDRKTLYNKLKLYGLDI
jgi:two-component system response regulator HydG